MTTTDPTAPREVSHDWRQSLALWTAEEQQRHRAETARLISVGWNPLGAGYVAYQILRERMGVKD